MDSIFVSHGLHIGRMISASKKAPEGHFCVWNANVITKTHGKVWFGDLNITKDAPVLEKIALAIGEPIYILRESDCRFNTANDSIEILIKKAIWRTQGNNNA